MAWLERYDSLDLNPEYIRYDSLEMNPENKIFKINGTVVKFVVNLKKNWQLDLTEGEFGEDINIRRWVH